MDKDKIHEQFTEEQLGELAFDDISSLVPGAGALAIGVEKGAKLARPIAEKVVGEIIEHAPAVADEAAVLAKNAATAVENYLKDAHVTKVMAEAVPNEVEKTLLMKLKDKLPESIADAIPVSWRDALQVATTGRAVSSDRKAYLAELYNSDKIEDGVRVVKTQLLGQAAPYVATLGGGSYLAANMIADQNQEQKDAAYAEKLAKMPPNERLAAVFQDAAGNKLKERAAVENPEYQKLAPAFKHYHDEVERIVKEDIPTRSPYKDEVSGQTSDKAAREIYQLKQGLVDAIKKDPMHLSSNDQQPKTLADAVQMIEKSAIPQQTKDAIYVALSEKVNNAGHAITETISQEVRSEQSHGLG